MTEMPGYLINQLQPEKIGSLFKEAGTSGDSTSAGNEQSTFFDGIFGLEKFRPGRSHIPCL
jgi:hypothetical protein